MVDADGAAPDNRDQLNVAGIGLGGLGTMTLEVVDQHPYSTVSAAYDSYPPTREAFEDTYADTFDTTVYDDLDAMLADDAQDLDAAYILSTHTEHYEQAKACLENGLAVFVEKPMATDPSDAAELVALADEHDSELHVGLQRHLHPGYQQVKNLIDSGEIGEIERVEAELDQSGWASSFLDEWRTDTDFSGGGELYDSGQHLLDAVFWLIGPPETVTAEDVVYIDEYFDLQDDDANRDHTDVYVDATMQLQRNGGAVTADIEVRGIPENGEHPDGHSLEEEITIYGTDGAVTYEKMGNGEVLAVARDETAEHDRGLDATVYDEGYRELVERKVDAFNRAVLFGEDTGAATGRESVPVVQATELVYESDEQDQPVVVDTPTVSEAPREPTAE